MSARQANARRGKRWPWRWYRPLSRSVRLQKRKKVFTAQQIAAARDAINGNHGRFDWYSNLVIYDREALRLERKWRRNAKGKPCRKF